MKLQKHEGMATNYFLIICIRGKYCVLINILINFILINIFKLYNYQNISNFKNLTEEFECGGCIIFGMVEGYV